MATAREIGNANLKPWQKGQSGNPSGRPKRLPISDAYRAIADRPFDVKANAPVKRKRRLTVAEAIADAQVRLALQGDTTAAKEIRESIEGKATQRIEVAPDLEGIKAIDVTLRIVKSETPR